jgi:mycothiol-dependent nitroreductase-like protein
LALRGSHVITEALEEAGLPASLASSATSIQVEQLIKDSHHEAFDEVGLDVGARQRRGLTPEVGHGVMRLASA